MSYMKPLGSFSRHQWNINVYTNSMPPSCQPIAEILIESVSVPPGASRPDNQARERGSTASPVAPGIN